MKITRRGFLMAVASAVGGYILAKQPFRQNTPRVDEVAAFSNATGVAWSIPWHVAPGIGDPPVYPTPTPTSVPTRFPFWLPFIGRKGE
jgi:hypothetical protein